MSEVDANAELTKVLGELNKSVTAMRGELDDAKKFQGRTSTDVVTTEKVDRINARVGQSQRVLDNARRANASATTLLKRVQADRMAAPPMARGRGVIPGYGVDRRQMTAEHAEHRKAFHAWFRTGRDEHELRGIAIKAALQTQSDPDGGFVVPFTLETVIDRVLMKYSAVRSLARVIQISTGVYKKPVNLGGAGAGWVTETQARPITNTPTLSELDFPVMEEYANPAATQTILDDAAIDIEAWLSEEVGIKFAEQEGLAFVSGTGVGQPRGFLSYTNVLNSAYTWGTIGYVKTTDANTFDPVTATENPNDILINQIFALKRGYRQNASFLANDLTIAFLRKIKDTTGQYIWQPSIQLGQPGTLNGYPIESDDNMPDIVAQAFPLAFADWSQAYLIIDRIGIRVLRDPFTNKPYVQFYTTKRVGGGIQNFEAIKLLKVEA